MLCTQHTAPFLRASPPSLRKQQPARIRCQCQRQPLATPAQPEPSRRAALACLSALCALNTATSAHALGIDTLQSIFPDSDPKTATGAVTSATKKKLQDADDAFENSELLKKLRQQTTDNTKRNKIDLQNKYCYRQAELGIGDCGGLQLIPGMTKNGKQKTPDWLNKILGVKDEDVPKEVARPLGFPDINGKPTS